MSPPSLPSLVAARERHGASGARALARQAASPARLTREAVLDAHSGCVNHLCWSADGTKLFTGSDDTRLVVWDVGARAPLATVPTGHSANIFCVRPLPHTGDAVVATCAGDAQARGSLRAPRRATHVLT
jgi:WD40 repeat protein